MIQTSSIVSSLEKIDYYYDFEKIKEIFPDGEISTGELDFSFKNKNLSMESAQETLYKIQKIAGEVLGESTDLKIDSIENNFFFLKKYNFRIDFDLQILFRLRLVFLRQKLI